MSETDFSQPGEASSGSVDTLAPVKPEANPQNSEAQPTRITPVRPSLVRRIVGPLLGAFVGGSAVEATHKIMDANPTDRPPAAVAAPAPGFQENTLPVISNVAAGSADLSLSEDALKALGKEQKITELKEKYGMVHEKRVILSSGINIRMMSDADIFATGSDEEFKTSMDALFNAPFSVIEQMPDSPYKNALLEAKGKAEKGLLSGREVVFAIPSDPKKAFMDPNDPFGSTEGVPVDVLAQKSPTGALLGEKGPSPVQIFALNAGSSDGVSVVRSLNGQEYNVSVAQYVASQAAHELAHIQTRAVGIPWDKDFGKQEAFMDQMQAALLTNGNLQTPFKFPSVQ